MSPGGRNTPGFPCSPEGCWQQQASHGADVDRSSKLSMSTREVRDMLNRSHMLSEQGVYKSAAERQSAEVSQLHINNLPAEATNESLARVCRAFGHQVVDVRTERNAAKNCCVGKAKVLLRSSPASASTPELVRFLEGRAGCSVRQGS